MPAVPATSPSSPRRLRARRLRLPSVKALLALFLGTALLAGGWIWLRSSSLVAVEQVKVTGVGKSPGGAAIRSSLTSVAMDMTTLNVDRGALDEAVRRFPVVKSLEVSTDFPHGMRIAVTQRRPVAALVGGGVPVAVAADGVLLKGERTAGLPAVNAKVPFGAPRLTGGRALEQVRLLAAAPPHLRSRVSAVIYAGGGYTVRVAGYPELRFGPPDRLQSKWAAAGRILKDPSVAGASYVDLRVPERPAVGPSTGSEEGFIP